MSETSGRATVRERNRLALRRDITEAAMPLLLEQGFAATTVDQIAAAAGVSRRTFFHHFPTKEDVVLGDVDALGDRILHALESRDDSESPWIALGEAFREMGREQEVDSRLAMAHLYAETPSLRARHLEKHLRWQELFAPEVARRMGIPADDALTDPRPRALIAAALSCIDVAIEAWRTSGGLLSPEEAFWECVAAIRS